MKQMYAISINKQPNRTLHIKQNSGKLYKCNNHLIL